MKFSIKLNNKKIHFVYLTETRSFSLKLSSSIIVIFLSLKLEIKLFKFKALRNFSKSFEDDVLK